MWLVPHSACDLGTTWSRLRFASAPSDSAPRPPLPLGLLASLQSRQRVSSSSEVWPKPQRLLVVLDGFRRAAQLLQCKPQVEMRFDVIGFAAQGLFILRNGLRQLTHALEDGPQIAVRLGLGETGLDP